LVSLQSYPVLPLRDIVVFPHMIVPLFVGREKSVRALEDVMKHDKKILLLSQKDASNDDPNFDDIQKVGTIGSVLQLLKLPDGTVKVLVEGDVRAEVVEFTENENFFQALAQEIIEPDEENDELTALSRTTAELFEQYIKLNKKIPPEVISTVNEIEDSSKLADTIASHLAIKLHEKQNLLEISSTSERLEKICNLMDS